MRGGAKGTTLGKPAKRTERMDSYKPGQGSLARLTVTVLLLIVAFLGCVELYSYIQSRTDRALIDLELFRNLPFVHVPLSWKFLLCLALFVGFVWLIRRYMARRNTVDTLVEVEMEMKKVSWPTRQEAMNATWVVVFVSVLITMLLFLFDIMLRYTFGLIF